LAVIYREGGFYSDWKEICFKDGVLADITNETNFWAAKDRPNPCINFQNAFFGAVPRHPIIAKALGGVVMNVQGKSYGLKPWFPTGPCILGGSIAELGYDENKIGLFMGNNRYLWKGENVAIHKCDGCGGGNNWTNGNNYWDLWRERKAFCDNASLIFE
jgi:hypothetical protein